MSKLHAIAKQKTEFTTPRGSLAQELRRAEDIGAQIQEHQPQLDRLRALAASDAEATNRLNAIIDADAAAVKAWAAAGAVGELPTTNAGERAAAVKQLADARQVAGSYRSALEALEEKVKGLEDQRKQHLNNAQELRYEVLISEVNQTIECLDEAVVVSHRAEATLRAAIRYFSDQIRFPDGRFLSVANRIQDAMRGRLDPANPFASARDAWDKFAAQLQTDHEAELKPIPLQIVRN